VVRYLDCGARPENQLRDSGHIEKALRRRVRTAGIQMEVLRDYEGMFDSGSCGFTREDTDRLQTVVAQILLEIDGSECRCQGHRCVPTEGCDIDLSAACVGCASYGLLPDPCGSGHRIVLTCRGAAPDGPAGLCGISAEDKARVSRHLQTLTRRRRRAAGTQRVARAEGGGLGNGGTAAAEEEPEVDRVAAGDCDDADASLEHSFCGLATFNDDKNPFDCGRMEEACPHCRALYWALEAGSNKKYSACCRNGDVVLDLERIPGRDFRALYADQRFTNNIRRFNHKWAMASAVFTDDRVKVSDGAGGRMPCPVSALRVLGQMRTRCSTEISRQFPAHEKGRGFAEM